ncbi:uncharacterized protein [Diabrotica undecimpunctata]|uniref:uncharacterized protein n=1 Tax=Diabrotica undecimpunctata TaxID=50387 RepID=UPI003B631B8A
MDSESAASSTVTNFPSKVNNFAVIVNGEHTDIALTTFTNYQNLIITQFEKIGNFYQVKVDQPANGLTVSEKVYNIKQVLGAENVHAEVAVRYLTEKLSIQKPLLVCLSLKDYSRRSLDIIIESIVNHK